MGFFIAACVFALISIGAGFGLRDALNAGANTVPWSTGLLCFGICSLVCAIAGFF